MIVHNIDMIFNGNSQKQEQKKANDDSYEGNYHVIKRDSTSIVCKNTSYESIYEEKQWGWFSGGIR